MFLVLLENIRSSIIVQWYISRVLADMLWEVGVTKGWRFSVAGKDESSNDDNARSNGKNESFNGSRKNGSMATNGSIKSSEVAERKFCVYSEVQVAVSKIQQ